MAFSFFRCAEISGSASSKLCSAVQQKRLQYLVLHVMAEGSVFRLGSQRVYGFHAMPAG